MQTFLPYENFFDSAEVLHQKHLGKQRVETLQIMKALVTNTGWIHHPATKMWRGYETYLVAYQYAITEEWKRRGYFDTCMEKTTALYKLLRPRTLIQQPPYWLGDAEFHLAHQSNLLRKKPEWYGRFFAEDVPDDLPYIWPKPLERV